MVRLYPRAIRFAGLIAGILALLSIVPSAASAQYRPPDLGSSKVLGEQYHVEVSGSIWNPALFGVISSEQWGIPGTKIDFINDLGYKKSRIRDFRIVSSEEFNQGEENKKKHRPYDTLTVELKFGRNRERVITDLKRVSKPGRRVYARKDRLPRVLGGMGISILSTSNGLITSRTAAEKGVGGEVICFVW